MKNSFSLQALKKYVEQSDDVVTLRIKTPLKNGAQAILLKRKPI